MEGSKSGTETEGKTAEEKGRIIIERSFPTAFR